MKAKISLIILVILLIGSIAGTAYLYNKSASSENKLADNESVISDLRSANSQLETNVSELEQTIADLEQQIADLQSANDELQGTIADLQAKITEAEYFKEATELYAQYKSELNCDEFKFREVYTGERLNGSSKDEALETMLDLFKKQEQPKQQSSSTTQNTTETKQPAESSQNSTSSSNKSLDEKLAELGLPPQQDMPTAERNTNGNYWGGDGITAQ